MDSFRYGRSLKWLRLDSSVVPMWVQVVVNVILLVAPGPKQQNRSLMVLRSIRHFLQQDSYLARIWLKCRRSWFSCDGVVSEMSEASGVVDWLWRELRGGTVQQVVQRRADGEPLGDISEEVEGDGEDTSHSDDHRWSQSLISGRTMGVQSRRTEAIMAKRVEGLQDIPEGVGGQGLGGWNLSWKYTTTRIIWSHTFFLYFGTWRCSTDWYVI